MSKCKTCLLSSIGGCESCVLENADVRTHFEAEVDCAIALDGPDPETDLAKRIRSMSEENYRQYCEIEELKREVAFLKGANQRVTQDLITSQERVKYALKERDDSETQCADAERFANDLERQIQTSKSLWEFDRRRADRLYKEYCQIVGELGGVSAGLPLPDHDMELRNAKKIMDKLAFLESSYNLVIDHNTELGLWKDKALEFLSDLHDKFSNGTYSSTNDLSKSISNFIRYTTDKVKEEMEILKKGDK